MHEIRGDFWEELQSNYYDAACCTTNMVCKNNGDLVMGAGIAKEFAAKFPMLPKIWGKATTIIKNGKLSSNLIVEDIRDWNMDQTEHPMYLVSFPTKYHWREKADITLIKRSALQLYTISQSLGWIKILLPKPGCKNGGLNWKNEVKPILDTILDDRFWVISNLENK